MRVIKKGEKLDEKEFKKTCYKCRTTFLYFEKETEVDREGRYIKCPECNAFIKHP